MRITRTAIVSLAILLLAAPLLRAQDLSKYRNFSFGMNLSDLSKQIDANPGDVAVLHEHPALIQEMTWWPPQPYNSSRAAEPVGQILFSFYNGALYRMLVTYDNDATKGLTNEDMIQIVSAKYGEATKPVAEVNFPTNPSYRTSEKVIARWEDPHYSFNLFRSSWSNTFAIVMFTKQMDSQAGISIAESVKLEKQEAPQKEAERVKQEADGVELDRQKNLKALRP